MNRAGIVDDWPGWEWQDDLEHRRWIEEYDRAIVARNRRRPRTYTQTQLQQHRHKQEHDMRISEEFSGSWLKAIDLRGHHITVVISAVKREEIGQGEDREFKPVVYFEGKDKGLVLNKTNGTTIAELLGDDTDNWTGHAIVLYPTKVQFGSKMVDAVRVEAATSSPAETAPAPQAPPVQTAPVRPYQGVPESDFDDDIPFIRIGGEALLDEEKTVFQVSQRQAARGLL